MAQAQRKMNLDMSTPLRVAVIGYGLAGRVFHCPFISAVPGLELHTIVARSTAESAAQRYPNARILDSPGAAFADPDIDIVVIATPNATHVPLARTALLADKHVVVDKPFAPTSEEAGELIDLAARRGRHVVPFHNRRFDGDFLTVRRLLVDGTLGRITDLHSSFDRYRPLQRPNSWKEESGPGSGLLYDLGPHLLDQALAAFGTPRTIFASVRTDRDHTNIDDAFDILLEFDHPQPDDTTRTVRYHCSATMLAADSSPRFRVNGTLGSYVKYGVDPQEPAVIAGATPPQLGTDGPWFPEPASAWGVLTLATRQTEPVQLSKIDYPTVIGDYRLFYANLRDAVHGNAALAVPASAGLRAIRLLEMALQSSNENRPLPVNFEPDPASKIEQVWLPPATTRP
jgi:scyllo-inositol 2-dehydrogenase (NADP+)